MTIITTCPKCESDNIKELNPEVRETTRAPLCKIKCKCNDCGKKFKIDSWTSHGKSRGILY